MTESLKVEKRPRTKETVPADTLPAHDALKQEGPLSFLNLAESTYRRRVSPINCRYTGTRLASRASSTNSSKLGWYGMNAPPNSLYEENGLPSLEDLACFGSSLPAGSPVAIISPDDSTTLLPGRLLMEPEELYRLFQPQPFQPVRVYLKDGRTFDIRSRQMVVVGWTYLAIGIQATDAPEGIIARSVHVPLDDILRVEGLTPTAAQAS